MTAQPQEEPWPEHRARLEKLARCAFRSMGVIIHDEWEAVRAALSRIDQLERKSRAAEDFLGLLWCYYCAGVRVDSEIERVGEEYQAARDEREAEHTGYCAWCGDPRPGLIRHDATPKAGHRPRTGEIAWVCPQCWDERRPR